MRRCQKEKGREGEEHQKWDGISLMGDSLGSGEVGEGSGQESLLERRLCDHDRNRGCGGTSQPLL